MNITHGLKDGSVLQRGPRSNVARIAVDGDCRAAGTVECSVNGGPFVACGRAASGCWKVRRQTMAVGGPFTLTFRIRGTRETCTVRDCFVGDLWVLAGQSNMVGAGRYEDPEKPVGPVRVYDKTGTWRIARDPLDGPDRAPSIGLGMTFGKTIHGLTGTPVGLIPCALGSSSMADWSPDRRVPGEEPLYRADRCEIRRGKEVIDPPGNPDGSRCGHSALRSGTASGSVCFCRKELRLVRSRPADDRSARMRNRGQTNENRS